MQKETEGMGDGDGGANDDEDSGAAADNKDPATLQAVVVEEVWTRTLQSVDVACSKWNVNQRSFIAVGAF